MSNWKYRLFQLMQGRYGMDSFGKFLLITSMIVVLLSNFIHIRFVYLLGLALLVYGYFRMMSRNIPARQRENQKYLSLTYGLRQGFSGMKAQSQQRQYYAFYKCKSCGQSVRVPKGKGKINITCPGCGNVFMKKT